MKSQKEGSKKKKIKKIIARINTMNNSQRKEVKK
jgi:ribosomal protein L29